jgi:hypothetical protein
VLVDYPDEGNFARKQLLSAEVQDQDGARLVLTHMGKMFTRLKVIWPDSAVITPKHRLTAKNWPISTFASRLSEKNHNALSAGVEKNRFLFPAFS